MRSYLLLIVCCLALSCSKEEPSPSPSTTEIPKNDYLINGVSDVNTRQDTVINIPLAIALAAGAQEQVNLSVTGLPEKITAKFSSENGTPSFASILTLTIPYSAPTGTHAVKIKGSSASGVNKEYPFNLKVDPVADCKEKLVGSYMKEPGGYFWGDDVIIKIIGDGKIQIENLPLDGQKATATVNCENKTFTINIMDDGSYLINGTGIFINTATTGILELDLYFKGKNGFADKTYKTKLVKK